ncbi:MAG: type II toxin-antitoxin system death-on-curing family toxin [Bacteroidetes bacterium]|nr:type II toxin-antitoxin system death-on-curing family toxin [Bacteroidota bacterium]MCL5737673.1 type II toxin-antitoxin system death-on-curing family toxin [Bacteroidota bacterium]
MTVHFIPEELVLTIHADLLQRYGGQHGLRDRNLLESALAQPRVTIGGKFAHKTNFDKAAAYGYHVCKNHPFIDGNKRVAFVLMDVFLQRNGWEIVAHEEDAYSVMIDLASGKLSKTQLASWLKKHSSKLSHD